MKNVIYGIVSTLPFARPTKLSANNAIHAGLSLQVNLYFFHSHSRLDLIDNSAESDYRISLPI